MKKILLFIFLFLLLGMLGCITIRSLTPQENDEMDKFKDKQNEPYIPMPKGDR